MMSSIRPSIWFSRLRTSSPISDWADSTARRRHPLPSATKRSGWGVVDATEMASHATPKRYQSRRNGVVADRIGKPVAAAGPERCGHFLIGCRWEPASVPEMRWSARDWPEFRRSRAGCPRGSDSARGHGVRAPHQTRVILEGFERALRLEVHALHVAGALQQHDHPDQQDDTADDQRRQP